MSLIKNKKNGSSKNYNELPLEISQDDYDKLEENKKKYYSQQCFFKKMSLDEMNRIQREKNNYNAKISLEKKRRANEIRNNPNIEITDYELKNLPLEEQKNWKYSRSEGPERNLTIYYKRKKIENSLNWKATHLKNIRLTQSEYDKLNPETKALGWVKISVKTGMQEYENQYRRRVPKDDILDKILNNIKKKQLNMNTLLDKGILYETKYYITKETLPTNSIQTNKTEYITLSKSNYNSYIKLDRELLNLKREKYEIEKKK